MRPWYDVPAVACNAKPAQCATRRTVSRKEAQYLSSSLARAVSRRFRSSQFRGKTLRRQEASLPRHAPVVRRASCGLQHHASAACHSAHAHLRSLCLGRRRSSRACYARARRGALDVLGSPFVEGRRAGERHLSFGVRPWCDVPAAASSAKPAPRATQRRRTCALSVWGGGAARELATCARRAALVVLGRHCVEERCAGERPLSFGCGRGATCQLRPPTPSQRRVSLSAGAPALSVSGEEAQHASLLRARAVPRWLCSGAL